MTFVGTGICVATGIAYAMFYLVNKIYQVIKRKKERNDK